MSALTTPVPAGTDIAEVVDGKAYSRALSSADRWVNITPGAGLLAAVPRALYIAGAGTVIARGADNIEATFTVPAASILPIRPIAVTGGTATGIVGLY